MNDVITSSKNLYIKHLRKLISSPKTRRETSTYVAEGTHLVKSLLASDIECKRYFCAESALQNEEISDLVRQLDVNQVPAVVVADSLFESVSAIHAQVGIMAYFTLPSVERKLLRSSAVLLDDVQDPGNLGTILRTSAAAGIDRAYLSEGCASPWSPKALRAGMGAQFAVVIEEDSNLKKVIEASEVPVVVTSLQATSSVYEYDLAKDVAWLFGSEGRGVSDELLKLNVDKVIIPHSQNIESLNVAAATAICLFEQVRQRASR